MTYRSTALTTLGLLAGSFALPAEAIEYSQLDRPPLGATGTGDIAWSADHKLSAVCIDHELQLIDTSNPLLTTQIGVVTLPDACAGVTMASSGTSNFAYVAARSAGLLIVDVTQPANASVIGTYDTPGTALEVIVSGTTAFIADGSQGVDIVNISNPAAPTLIKDYKPLVIGYTLASNHIALSSTYLYFVVTGSNRPGTRYNGVWILDVKSPSRPKKIQALTDTTFVNLNGLIINGSTGYQLDNKDAHVLDFAKVTSSCACATVAGHITDLSASNAPQDAAAWGTELLIADRNAGLFAYDITNPLAPVSQGPVNTVNDLSIDPVLFVTASNGWFAATTPDDTMFYRWFDTPAASELGAYDSPGTALDVALTTVAAADGNHNFAYVADGAQGLRILNVDNPANPQLVGSYSTGAGSANAVKVVGSYAYVAYGTQGLRIVNVSNPASPTLTGYLPLFSCNGIAVSGSYAYVADGTYGVRIVQISAPSLPILKGTLDTPGTAYDVKLGGAGHLFVADGTSGIELVDITTLTAPVLKGTVAVSNGGAATNLYVDAREKVFAAAGAGGLLGIHVNSADGNLVTDLSLPGLTNAMGVTHGNWEDTLLVTVDGMGLYKIDVSSPAQPVTIGHVTTRDIPRHLEGDLNGRTWVTESGAGLVAVQF